MMIDYDLMDLLKKYGDKDSSPATSPLSLYRVLIRGGINTLSQFREASEQDLLDITGVGEKRLYIYMRAKEELDPPQNPLGMSAEKEGTNTHVEPQNTVLEDPTRKLVREKVANRLRFFRDAEELTIEELSKKAGVSKTVIFWIESSDPENSAYRPGNDLPSLRVLISLSEALHIGLADLFRDL